MTFWGVELKDWASVMSFVLAAATAIATAVGARGPARVRAKLDTETSIWSRLPQGAEKDAMWALASQSIAQLVQLEDPQRRRRRKAYILFGGFVSVLFAANAIWSYWTDGAAGAIRSSIVLVVGVALLFIRDWWQKRQGAAPAEAAGETPNENQD